MFTIVAITLRRDEPSNANVASLRTPDRNADSSPEGSSRRSVTATLENSGGDRSGIEVQDSAGVSLITGFV
jgi:hypothetical protein